MREHLKSAATSLKAVSRTNPYSRARIAVGQVVMKISDSRSLWICKRAVDTGLLVKA
jgi:hypothetical protein